MFLNNFHCCAIFNLIGLYSSHMCNDIVTQNVFKTHTSSLLLQHKFSMTHTQIFYDSHTTFFMTLFHLLGPPIVLQIQIPVAQQFPELQLQ